MRYIHFWIRHDFWLLNRNKNLCIYFESFFTGIRDRIGKLLKEKHIESGCIEVLFVIVPAQCKADMSLKATTNERLWQCWILYIFEIILKCIVRRYPILKQRGHDDALLLTLVLLKHVTISEVLVVKLAFNTKKIRM